jgi:uncharacterized protein YcbX
MLIGTVERIVRYPVKSMRGEELAAATLSLRGLPGDRAWVFARANDRSPFPWLTARHLPHLLLYRPRFATPYDAPGREPPLFVETPAGERYAIDDPALLTELEERAGCRLHLLHTKLGVPDNAPLSIFNLALVEEIGERASRTLDPLRFRANIYLRPVAGGCPPDAELVGRTLAIGAEARVAVVEQDERCRMISLDPETAERDPEVQNTVITAFDNCAGLYAVVTRPGRIAAGDAIVIE